MARVRLSQLMSRLFPEHQGQRVGATNVGHLLDQLDQLTPGLNEFLRNQEGALRPSVNIIINGESLKDRNQLSDTLEDTSEVLIVQQDRE